MKRPIALLASLLAVTVLATAAMAAGGDSSDPLISLNYLQTTFTTKATSSIDAALDKADQAAYAKAEAALRSTIAAAEANVGAQRADVFTESRLKQGDILSGTTGLQVIVLAGSVNVQFSSGAVVDVTTGSEVKSGAALAENHRYLVAEDTTALFTVTGKTAVVNYCGFYSIMNLFHLDFLPKQMMDISYLGFLPFNINGSFISAYIFFGAIQEELIRCGKKSWVQLLTLSIMMLPASMMSVTPSGDINVDLTVLGFITLCYCSWIYGKTRSTIILFVLYFVSNLVPFHFESKVLGILLLIAGTALTIGGFAALSRKLPEMLVKDENE